MLVYDHLNRSIGGVFQIVRVVGRDFHRGSSRDSRRSAAGAKVSATWRAIDLASSLAVRRHEKGATALSPCETCYSAPNMRHQTFERRDSVKHAVLMCSEKQSGSSPVTP